jgi:large subunit ribosomal protein L4
VAAPKAPVLDVEGRSTKDVALDEGVFSADIKAHLVHETVRAEQNARRSGTRGAKSRGLVSGGRSKPWRQKGTGRARQGTIRAPQFTGGGVAFPPSPRSFDVKVNRKARRAAFRSALTDHAQAGTLAILADDAFDDFSTRSAAQLLSEWDKPLPLVVVASDDQERILKSFRNLRNVLVTVPSELEVTEVVLARSLLVSEAALPELQGRAS